MKMKRNLVFLVLTTILLFSCNNNKTVNLSGAGATFPLPYYNMVFKTYRENTDINVNYGGIGSGGGIRSLKEGIVDFAGSDAFITDDEAKEMKQTIHIPTCLGAVVIAYNLPDVFDLKLTGDIIADIFLGKITKWNDKKIAEINPEINLPDAQITPVYRSDGSGTTFVFTDYLCKVSEEWNNTIGVGKSISFPTGLGAKGNPGVAGTIGQTEGTIGYIGSEYAFAQNIPISIIQNKSGNFIKPSSESISAAAELDFPADSRAMITNSPIENAYPISCLTWIIIYKEQNYGKRSLEQAKETLELLDYMLSDEAQKQTLKVHYAPLSENLIKNAKRSLQTVTYNGEIINK